MKRTGSRALWFTLYVCDMTDSLFLDVGDSTDFYPLNALKGVQNLHFGVRSIAKQWGDLLSAKPKVRIHSQLLPTEHAASIVLGLKNGQSWQDQGLVVAQCGDIIESIHEASIANDWLEDAASLFEKCGDGLASDLSRLKLTWRLRALAEEEREAWAQRGVVVHGPMDRIHLGPGALLRDVSLNTEEGDILLGPGAEIMEGCRVRGPFALGENSQLRMGTLIYGPASVGQGCKVGGELSNVVVHDWSNKAHGGFLGNAVIGEWCNLGAETTCSNLKNTYGEIAEWDEARQGFHAKGRQFCGLIMGDHSKTAIHTAFSTATVVGSLAQVFGPGSPPRHVLPFSWGHEGEKRQVLEKALSTVRRVMARRNQTLTPDQEQAIRHLHGDHT